MTRILVVYYSQGGHSKLVAEAIASACDADIEAIHEVKRRTGTLRSALEGLFERLTDISPVEKDPGDYDLVVVGTPVWVANISSPIRTYLTQQRDKFKQVAFFSTMGGIGGNRVLRKMAALSGQTPVASFTVIDRQLNSQVFQDKVKQFVEQIEANPAR